MRFAQFLKGWRNVCSAPVCRVKSAVGVSDDIQISHYSNEKQKWIREKVSAGDRMNGSVDPPDSKERILNLYYPLGNCTNSKCPEPHTLQRRVGCKVMSSSDKEKIQMAYDDYRFDGVDFITLNFKTMQWTDQNEKAAEIKMKWNSDASRKDFFRAYLNHCLTWILKNSYSTTKSPPNIQMFAKKALCDQSKMDLTCLATGFYPKHLQMDITMNGTKLQSPAEVRPNDDKTFQLRTTVRIKKEEKRGFECHVTHSSLTQPNITKWEDVSLYTEEVTDQMMETGGVFVICIFYLSLFRGTCADMKDTYMKIVDLVAPGQEFLTEDAVLSLCERLERGLQCSGVSCGKVPPLIHSGATTNPLVTLLD
ncbi:H-2 class I histocompatibility antigen, K-B alpha chain [Triplophysa tibetana]|uniref:H-2 class I histocompatibility antigen, K-B alpha chain n=1 Tax=Triplophysa tibetana TaxID=1572043 RepID=A0A5A9NLX6_9TELE|nr:H-2 class I histocompatibility antigen, K-B alpha chain [Triplophysa tibetana]